MLLLSSRGKNKTNNPAKVTSIEQVSCYMIKHHSTENTALVHRVSKPLPPHIWGYFRVTRLEDLVQQMSMLVSHEFGLNPDNSQKD